MKHHLSKHRPLLTIFFVSCLMICLFAAITEINASAKRKKIDKKCYAFYIDQDGNVLEQFTIHLKGKIIYKKGKGEQLTITIEYPSDFRYQYSLPSEGYWSAIPEKYRPASYLIWSTVDYDCEQNHFSGASYAFAPEEGHLIACWDDDEDARYLVASANPVADPRELLSYFNSFIDFIN